MIPDVRAFSMPPRITSLRAIPLGPPATRYGGEPDTRGGLSRDLAGVRGLAPRRRRVRGPPGAVAVARRVRLPSVRGDPGVATVRAAAAVRHLPPGDLGDGGNGLRPHPLAAHAVVRGGLARALDQQRRLGARAAEAAGPGQLRDGVGVAANGAPGGG